MIALICLTQSPQTHYSLFQESIITQLCVFESCKYNLALDVPNIAMAEDAGKRVLVNSTIRVHRDLNNSERTLRPLRFKNKEAPVDTVQFTIINKNNCFY